MNSLTQTAREIKTLNLMGLTLEAAVEAVVPGADPAWWASQLDRLTAAPVSRKPRTPTRRASGKPSRRHNYAADICGRAIAELVYRVNSQADDGNSWNGAPIPFEGEPVPYSDDLAECPEAAYGLPDRW